MGIGRCSCLISCIASDIPGRWIDGADAACNSAQEVLVRANALDILGIAASDIISTCVFGDTLISKSATRYSRDGQLPREFRDAEKEDVEISHTVIGAFGNISQLGCDGGQTPGGDSENRESHDGIS